MDFREQNFGIEIEMTGITRENTAKVIAEYFGTSYSYDRGNYDEYSVKDTTGRKWKIVSDSSINPQVKENDVKVSANNYHRVELVSPICQYDDIEKIQEIVRCLRQNKAFINSSCGIHIHINASPYTAKQLCNLVKIVASKEDLIYRALQVNERRESNYCRKVNSRILEQINTKKPTTREQLSEIWYNGSTGAHSRYHDSRYHCLNLHSVFQKNTIEIRAFNSNLHAGKIKAYIQFCMAVTAQAYNQKSASSIKTVTDNDKYTFRVWLLRLGMIGDEFKTARKHLLDHLDGNSAWKNPEKAKKMEQTTEQIM